MRMRDMARHVGITERAVQGIVKDLVSHGYIEKERQGRRNSYSVARGRALRHPILSHRLVDDLIALVTSGPLCLAQE
jgi:DNA-binding MarR family transcriptional regulator